MSREHFATRVANELIAQLERGTAPFQLPWSPSGVLPINPTTEKRYRGVNAFYLFAQGRADPRWLTYRQAESIGAQVRRGEKGTPIQYWKFNDERVAKDSQGRPIVDEAGNKKRVAVALARPQVFTAVVFNAEQVDGMPALPARVVGWDPCQRAEEVLVGSGARIDHGARDRAFYRLNTDTIHLPQRDQFHSREGYYATALHELGHWTGHPTRLHRDLAHPFGSEGYAREELRAEIASLLLGYELGVGHDHQSHASYVANWISVLKRDPLEIVRAAADAEKITDYVLGLVQTQRLDRASSQQAEGRAGASASAANSVVHFWKPEPVGSEIGPECLSFEYPARFVVDGRTFQTLEHYVLFEQARLAGSDELAAQVLRATDPTDIKALGRMLPHSDESRQDERVIDAVLGGNAAKFRQNEPLLQYLIGTGDKVLAACSTDQHWGIGLVAADPRARDRTRWRGDNLLGFALMAVRGQLRLEQVAQTGLHEDVFQHAGLRCTVKDQRSALSGDTWLTGYVDLPAQHPLHGHDFLEDGSHGIFVRKGFSDCERTEVGEWRVGFDSAGQPDVVRAEFVGYVREVAEQLADRARQRDAATVEEWFFVHAGLRCAITRETGSEGALLEGHVDLPRGHADHGRELRHDESSRTSMRTLGSPLPSGLWRVSFPITCFSPDTGPIHSPEMALREVLNSYPELREAMFAEVRGAAEQLAARASQQDEEAMRKQRETTQVSPARHWLAVPYAERKEAQASGARWDTGARCWYAPKGADLAQLGRWEPGPATDYAPALEAREEFAQVLRDLGCLVSGDHPIMDGRPHRLPTHGDRRNEKAGFYIASNVGIPSGFAQDNRTGQTSKWVAKGHRLNQAERAQAHAAALREQEERERERKRLHAETAEYLERRLATFVAPAVTTPYLASKGVQSFDGVFTDRNGSLMVVPGYDASGKLWTLQYIQPDGTKRFARNSRQAGCCHPIGGWQAVASAPLLILAEGYSTAATIAQVLQRPTIACFNAANLVQVARDLHARFPNKSVLIAADDDRELEERNRERFGSRPNNNPGQFYAHQAADAVGGLVATPVFAPGEDELTDFNDLANRSVFGRDAVERQLKAAMASLQRERSQAQVNARAQPQQQLRRAGAARARHH